MAIKSCNYPIEIYVSSFSLRLLCILIRPAKLQYTYHEKNTQFKQCYACLVFLFIVRLTFSFIIMRHTLSSLTLSFIIMRFTLSFIIMCPCLILYNSNSILLFFANHAFFKYDKPINM
jgi:hypothetical protein